MSRIVYVNGRYVPYAQAAVHVEDRGFQFADAIYEVCEVYKGRLVDLERHLARLRRSLGEIELELARSDQALERVMRETVRRNLVSNGSVYLQVTRGAAPRDFPFPDPVETEPTVVCIARSISRAAQEAQAARGIAVKTMPDIRWGRCDIKTVMLLPACLAKTAAYREGASEAWLVDREGFVTEGSSSNAWIIDGEGRLITRRADSAILAGVTRATLLDLIEQEGLEVVFRPFRPAEVVLAREAFITSATNTVMPVVRVDGGAIGSGQPGPIARRLRAKFHGDA
mgnify:FL=1